MGELLALLQNAPPSPRMRDLVFGVSLISFVIVLGYTAHYVAFRVLSRIRKEKPRQQSKMFAALDQLRGPARLIVILTGVAFAVPWLHVPHEYIHAVYKSVAVAWFASLGWLMVACVYVAEDIFVSRYDITVADNLRARRIRTQTQLLRRIAIILLLIIDAGLILSVFRDSQIWHYGAGLLASAGLASLVLATAAKSSASNLLAGLQIALTEPIRLDDVVVVQGYWGKIEEITTTYVVIAVWDQRRLIVPLSYFIENSFENWTRDTAELLGDSFLYVDYSVPVEPLRQEFTRILKESSQWDGRVNALQVTDICQGTMQIRCLLSARNSGDQFDLRCIVREKMMAFIQKNYPDAFPRTRFVAISAENRENDRNAERFLTLQNGPGH